MFFFSNSRFFFSSWRHRVSFCHLDYARTFFFFFNSWIFYRPSPSRDLSEKIASRWFYYHRSVHRRDFGFGDETLVCIEENSSAALKREIGGLFTSVLTAKECLNRGIISGSRNIRLRFPVVRMSSGRCLISLALWRLGGNHVEKILTLNIDGLPLKIYEAFATGSLRHRELIRIEGHRIEWCHHMGRQWLVWAQTRYWIFRQFCRKKLIQFRIRS